MPSRSAPVICADIGASRRSAADWAEAFYGSQWKAEMPVMSRPTSSAWIESVNGLLLENRVAAT